MRAMLIAAAVLVAMVSASEAQHYRSWGHCAWPAAHGGPCGCVAMDIVGLRNPRYWAVRNWFDFPRTEPYVGAAAIWRNHSHVEIVSRVNGDNTVDTRGSVGWRHVPRSRLVFVQPPNSKPKRQVAPPVLAQVPVPRVDPRREVVVNCVKMQVVAMRDTIPD